MPFSFTISEKEVELAKKAGVGKLEGAFFTYDPAETMAIMAKVVEAGGVDDVGVANLTTRLANAYTIYRIDKGDDMESVEPKQATEAPKEAQATVAPNEVKPPAPAPQPAPPAPTPPPAPPPQAPAGN